MIDEKVLIERLEERRKNIKRAMNKFGPTTELVNMDRAFIQTIQDVNQLAEEHNNGWIPCSEKLPGEPNNYLVTQYNENAIDEYCNGYRVERIFFDDNGWWDNIDCDCGWTIIAWQPLPKSYNGGYK